MKYLLITSIIATGYLLISCAEECTPNRFENYKLEVNLDNSRNYLSATGQTLGLIKVIVKDANNNLIDASNNTQDLRLRFTFTGGGEARDFDDRVYPNNIAPIGSQFTEVFWYMGPNPGNNTMKIELVQEIGQNENISFCGDFPGVDPVTYTASAESDIPKPGVLSTASKVFVVGDGENFKQTWVSGNQLRNSTPASLASQLGIDAKCPEDIPQNCSNYGALVNWLGAVEAFPPESNHTLPSQEEIDALINYLQEIGVEDVAEYFYYAPFNLDTKRGGGYFGDQVITELNNQTNGFDKINEMTIFWLADRVDTQNARAFAYRDNGNQQFVTFDSPAANYYNIRLIQK